MNQIKLQNRQSGAALVVGLVLLVVVTVLAVSGMNTATTELAMARNDQNYENAFQAAETGLEQALSQGRFNTLNNVNLVQNINANESSYVATIQFRGRDAGTRPGIQPRRGQRHRGLPLHCNSHRGFDARGYCGRSDGS